MSDLIELFTMQEGRKCPFGDLACIECRLFRKLGMTEDPSKPGEAMETCMVVALFGAIAGLQAVMGQQPKFQVVRMPGGPGGGNRYPGLGGMGGPLIPRG
jgi:hypothetical protein